MDLTDPTRTPPPELAEGLLAAVWTHSADAIAVSSPEGTVVAANPAYFSLFGYAPEEVLGRDFALIFPPDERDAARAQYRDVFGADRAPPAFESRVVRGDGGERVVEARIEFVHEADGRRTAMVNTIRDVTERARADQEKEEFLSLLTHDLQGPLTSVKGYAQALARRLARGEVDRQWGTDVAAHIEAAADRMLDMTTELLDLSRVRAGRGVPVRRVSADLAVLVRRAVDEQRGADPAHEYVLTVPENPVRGLFDVPRLRRLVGNLLGNAAKYSPDGTAIAATLAVDEADGARAAVLRVRDEGIGIPAHDLPRVFERFHRGANTAAVEGNGLGLALAQQVVVRHEGAIDVESREGAGSTFTVRLPLG